MSNRVKAKMMNANDQQNTFPNKSRSSQSLSSLNRSTLRTSVQMSVHAPLSDDDAKVIGARIDEIRRQMRNDHS